MQKLQSASVGDCIHERAVTEASGKKTSAKAGHMSIRSLTSDNNGDLMPPNPTQAPLSPAQIKGKILIDLLFEVLNVVVSEKHLLLLLPGHYNLSSTLSSSCALGSRCYSSDSCECSRLTFNSSVEVDSASSSTHMLPAARTCSHGSDVSATSDDRLRAQPSSPAAAAGACDTVSNRSTSSSDNSTCELLKPDVALV